ncbi:DUF411 domain-containing protein [Serpentinimonas maccroryi]|jgi:Cu/Ag efflux protein CusF|uniref:DUF411 domain-containing protein n=1 Tax=Serpentinimonas maccroryi TaxID=1458426 RepID=UPI002A022A18|nr:hypothetical protein [Serpentinimonas maccroryi]
MQRRTLLRSATALSGLAATTLLALSAPFALAQARRPLPVMEVWKDPQCGCCDDWITYLEKNGFSVRAFDTGNIAARLRLGMPEKYGSCHTALIGGYVVEGHVPAADIQRLLRERPAALGLSVPGMPIGSPGMDGPLYGGRRDPYHVLLVGRDGSSRIWASYHQPPAGAAAAQPAPNGADTGAAAVAATDRDGRPWVEAEVRRVDRSNRRVSLRHGPIPNLDMGGMTMVFQLSDPALLDQVQPGQRIRFSAALIQGEYTVMQIAPLP